MSNPANPADRPARAPSSGEWLFLVHQLPPTASTGRVRTWRRLQNLGAVWLRNAAYVLPNSAQAREDFIWLRGEIAGLGGAATIVVADAIDESDRRAIVEAFTAARAADYAALGREMAATERLLARAASGRRPGRLERRVKALALRLREIERIDYFAAPAGEDARQALAALENRMPGTARRRPANRADILDRQGYQERTWVTRRRPGVDRMSSAWLIRRFIDPAARFAFADSGNPLPAGQVAFDMFEGEFTHDRDRCTFEVLAHRFGLDDPAVRRIAAIVHDLDLNDRRYQPPEGPTIGTLIDGIRKAHPDDSAALAAGIDMFEGFYRAFDAQAAAAANQAGPDRRKASAKARRRRKRPAKR